MCRNEAFWGQHRCTPGACACAGASAVLPKPCTACCLSTCLASLQGLTEWQLNSYYAAGRVMVPALLDVFTCQGFFKRQALLDLLTELAGKSLGAGGLGSRRERDWRRQQGLIGGAAYKRCKDLLCKSWPSAC